MVRVAGTNSTLDRQLRGATSATAAAALNLPAGQRIERAYAYASFSALRSERGVLYGCTDALVFRPGSERHSRWDVPYGRIERVELTSARWRSEPTVLVVCRAPVTRLEFGGLSEVECDELVAFILDNMARLS